MTTSLWRGRGTEKDPYQLSDLASLKRLAQSVKEGEKYKDVHFLLTATIDVEERDDKGNVTPWSPIGNDSNAFYGHFHGNNRSDKKGGGCKLTGLRIHSDAKPSGFFAKIGEGGSVTELTLEGEVKAKLNGSSIGFLCGANYGEIGDCACTADVEVADETTYKATSTYVGIIAGTNGKDIRDCIVEGKISAMLYRPQLDDSIALYAGGIAGQNSKSIRGCEVAVEVVNLNERLKGGGKFPIYVNVVSGINGSGAELCNCFAPVTVEDDATALVVYIPFAINSEGGRIENCERRVFFENGGKGSQAIIEEGGQVSLYKNQEGGGKREIERAEGVLVIEGVERWGEPGKPSEASYATIRFEEGGCLQVYGDATFHTGTLINEKKGYSPYQYEIKFFGGGMRGRLGQPDGATGRPNQFALCIGALNQTIKIVNGVE